MQIYGYPPVAQGTNMQDKLGVTSTGFLYQYDTSVSSLFEGEYRLGTNTVSGYMDANLGAGLGTHVLKLWFDHNATTAQGYPNSDAYAATYPNTSFGTVNSLTDLASSAPMVQVFRDPNFNTYILEAFEFCQKTTGGAWEGTLWRSTSGTTFNFGTDIQTCVYNDFYNLTKYLLTTYSGTGKTFVLQNWEGDNALNGAQFTVLPSATENCSNTAETNYPAAWCQTVTNMRTWLMARWNGVNDARRDYEKSTSNVTVAAAAEVNLVDGWNTSAYPYPTAMDVVIPYLHMDLYSCSCYHPSVPPYGQTMNPVLQTYRAALPVPTLGSGSEPTLYGTNNLYVGEFGTPEAHWYSNDTWTESTSQKARVNTGEEVQGALSAGARWILYWQVYDNGTVSVNSAGNSLDGDWLIRPPCNATDSTQHWCIASHASQPAYSQTWNYFQNIMTQPSASYQYVYEAENFFTTVSGTGTEVDVADANLSGNYGTELQGGVANSTISYSMYVPNAGKQTLSIRVRTGPAQGSFTARLNSVVQTGTFDTYAATTGYKTLTISTQVLTAGTNTLDLIVGSKNALSTGNDLVVDSISIAPAP